MGLDYSFNFIARRDRVDALFTALADRLTDDHAGRLREVLPWAPQYPHTAAPGICGFPPDRGHSNYYGVIVRFPLDPEIQRFVAENYRDHESVVNGKAEIGMIYMQFYAGREFLLLLLWAATSDMSRMFAASPQVRATMLALAHDAQAHALFFDPELGDRWELLYPQAREAPQPEECPEELEVPEQVDIYCKRLLDSAELYPPGSPHDSTQ